MSQDQLRVKSVPAFILRYLADVLRFCLVGCGNSRMESVDEADDLNMEEGVSTRVWRFSYVSLLFPDPMTR